MTKKKINEIYRLVSLLKEGTKNIVFFFGAGFSKSAEIPSSWEIMKEIIRKKEILSENTNFDALELLETGKYKGKSFEEILLLRANTEHTRKEYLIKKLNKPKGEVHDLLGYFIKKDMVRAIITTNFDESIENYFTSKNFLYTTLVNSDFKEKRKPYHLQTQIQIIKPHGSLNKGKIKATPEELKDLPKPIKNELIKIIEEHIVIVIGYGGSDKSIQNLFDSVNFQYFPIFWSYYSQKPSGKMKDILDKKNAVFLHGGSADRFLEQIIEKWELLLSLSNKSLPHLDIDKLKKIIIQDKENSVVNINESFEIYSDIFSSKYNLFIEKYGSHSISFENKDFITLIKSLSFETSKFFDLCSLSFTFLEFTKLNSIFSNFIEQMVNSIYDRNNIRIKYNFIYLVVLIIFYSLQISVKMRNDSSIFGKLFKNIEYFNDKRNIYETIDDSINMCGDPFILKKICGFWEVYPKFKEKIDFDKLVETDILLFCTSISRYSIDNINNENNNIWDPKLRRSAKNLPKWLRKAYSLRNSKFKKNLFYDKNFENLNMRQKKYFEKRTPRSPNMFFEIRHGFQPRDS